MKNSVKVLTLTAFFMALNIALSSFGVPVPGGHLYLNDIVIVTAALLLDPLEAFLAGGIGSFLGDLIFYPTPMFVSLAVHGLQAAAISYISHHTMKDHPLRAAVIGVSVGALIMVLGYTAGRALIYSTPEAAVLKLPYQILQAAVGAVVGTFLVFKGGLKELYHKQIGA